MIVEHYRGGDPRPVYARFRERGRMAPEGLTYVSSWVTMDGAHCYQVTEGERALVDEWTANWADIVEFDIIPVIASADAARKFGGND